jgi:hypothetical protein
MNNYVFVTDLSVLFDLRPILKSATSWYPFLWHQLSIFNALHIVPRGPNDSFPSVFGSFLLL